MAIGPRAKPPPPSRGARRGLSGGVAGSGDAPGRAAAPRAACAAAPILPGQQPEAPARPRAMLVAALLCALCCGLLVASARAGYSEDRCSWRGRYGPQEGRREGGTAGRVSFFFFFFFHLGLEGSLPLGNEETPTSMFHSAEWTQVLVAVGNGGGGAG